MKRIIVFLALFFGAFNLHAQSNNWLKELGFETGSIAVSFRSDTAVCCPNQGWHMDNFTHVKLVNAGDTNILGGQLAPLDPLGGNHSLRLGYWHNNNPMIRLSDTMRVDSFNYYFRFSLAAIRKSYPGMLSIHGLPYFQLLDLNGNPLSVVNQVYFNGLNSYTWRKSSSDTSIQFLPWADQYINLSAYIGQKIIFAYEVANDPLSNPLKVSSEAYFDLRWAGTIAPNEAYCGGSNLQLNAPQGMFDSVVWRTNQGQRLGSGNSIVLSGLSGTNVGDSVEMILYPMQGQGIPTSYWHTLKMAPNLIGTIDFNTTEPCENIGTQFSLVNTSTCPTISTAWHFGDVSSGTSNQSSLFNPTHVYTTAGTYNVKLIATNAIGCIDSLTKAIAIFNAPTINAGADISVCPLQAVILNASISNASNLPQISWVAQNASALIATPNSASTGVLYSIPETFVLLVQDTVHQCHFYDTLNAGILLNCINNTPQANLDSAFMLMNISSPQIINVLGNDNDWDGSVSPQGNLTTASLSVIQNVNNGVLSFNAITKTYTYLPNTGFVGLDSFAYSISDNGSPNLSDTAVVRIHVVQALSVNTNTVNLNICKGTSVQLNPPLIIGGSGSYSYSWQPSFVANPNISCLTCPNPFIQPSSAGQFVLTITDNLISGQSASVLYVVNYDSIATNLTTSSVTYGDSLALGLANFTSVSPIASITWSPALNCGSCFSGFLKPTQMGYVHYNVVNSFGCTLQDSFFVYACSNDCVWPGDANHDGVVDNLDVLNIGLGYGWNGSSRTTVSSFIGQPASNWGVYTAPTIDAKHADCDGNGIINANDTLAINYYYGNTHPKQSSTNGIPVFVEFSAGTAYNGDHLFANIHIGSPSTPADSIYGVAFTFVFDTNVVVSNSAYIQSINNNWLATPNVDGIAMAFNQYNTLGELHYALARTNHTIKSGNGPVARADMDIQTGNIAGKGNQLKQYDFIARLKHVRIVDLQGNEKAYTLGEDTVIINYFTGISSLSAKQVFTIAPNPASDLVRVQSLFPITQASWRLMDMKGGLLMQGKNLPSQGANISTKELNNGVYLLQINAAEGVWQETVIVQH